MHKYIYLVFLKWILLIMLIILFNYHLNTLSIPWNNHLHVSQFIRNIKTFCMFCTINILRLIINYNNKVIQ